MEFVSSYKRLAKLFKYYFFKKTKSYNWISYWTLLPFQSVTKRNLHLYNFSQIKNPRKNLLLAKSTKFTWRLKLLRNSSRPTVDVIGSIRSTSTWLERKKLKKQRIRIRQSPENLSLNNFFRYRRCCSSYGSLFIWDR